MKTGFIGTGSMGSILVESFIQSGALHADQMMIFNRTKEKAEKLITKYPGLNLARSNIEIALECDVIFLCVKPMEYKRVVDEIKRVTLPDQIIVSITSPVHIKHLEEQLNCKIVKMIPSITNYELSGATLCMYGNRVTPSDKTWIEEKLSHFSTPMRIEEDYTRVTSDISSCGPAFLAFFIEKFVEAAVQETGIPQDQATKLASEMLLGTGKLLTSGGFSPASLQQRVAVPGGITAEGLRLLKNELEGVFNQLILTTHAKYNEDVDHINHLFLNKEEDH